MKAKAKLLKDYSIIKQLLIFITVVLEYQKKKNIYIYIDGDA